MSHSNFFEIFACSVCGLVLYELAQDWIVLEDSKTHYCLDCHLLKEIKGTVMRFTVICQSVLIKWQFLENVPAQSNVFS